MFINRYVMVIKAPNNAKFGAKAPKEAYINTFQEEIELSPEEEEELLLMEDQERVRAEQELAEYLAS